MRRLLSVAAVSAIAAAPVLAVSTATPASAEPSREPVKAVANTTQLSVRALTGLVQGHDAVDLNFAVAQASADSSATKKSTAAASNFTASVGGNQLPNPTTVTQSAPPDNATHAETGLDLSRPPLNSIVRAQLLTGSAQARWSDAEGACGGSSLSRSITTAANLAVDKGQLGNLLPSVTNLLGNGAVLSMPGTVRSTSEITLRSQPNGTRAVVAESRMQAADVFLFFGTSMQIEAKVISQPTLTAISTGDAATSTATYSAPVLEIIQGGRSLGRLDARNPTMNVPLLSGLPRQLNLSAVKLSIGSFAQAKNPDSGISAHAALLDVKLLPLGGGAAAQIVAGEQHVGALAPAGGVDCAALSGGSNGSDEQNTGGSDGQAGTPGADDGTGTEVDAAAQGRPDAAQLVDELAMTDAAYNPLPYISTGGLLLLFGSVLVAAVPRRRARNLDDSA